ncbi:hypothetical protein DOY81_000431 [Sarcophaga bullata]|nr:hypothetical protein DOY81_000431 [Sarcophaga bullata]
MYFNKIFLTFVVVLVLTIHLSHAGQKASKIIKSAGGAVVGGAAINSNLTVHYHPQPTKKPSSSKGGSSSKHK